MVDQVPESVRVQVFRWHLDKFLVGDATQVANLVELLPQVDECGAWRRHWVRKLLLVVKPEPVKPF